ncbi:hypothetical protein RB597_008731 [Gaeumannomyces tritici]
MLCRNIGRVLPQRLPKNLSPAHVLSARGCDTRLSPLRPILLTAEPMTTTPEQLGAEPEPADGGVSLAELPKSWRFTERLPADLAFPTPADSHKTPRSEIGPRMVRGALYTWVRPEPQEDPELLAVSPAAMRTLGLRASEASTEDFRQTVVGNRLHGWDDGDGAQPQGYPWAQCYGGFQFGSWAGQLGDGRVISLFEATNPRTGERHEVQLKGAGLTPYSRFADGKAVLRSSIRELAASEALHGLGIPTTRALALSLLPHQRARRETVEPAAIVVRFAQSWIRLGTFDLLRARGDRALIRRLATYVAEEVLGGWGALPGRLTDPSKAGEQPESTSAPCRGVPAAEVEGPDGTAENRFSRMYREVVRRNAETVAYWQAYGFMNGVLNTDNTSIMGLSMDFGPFAFLDNFDPSYTPNHDDASLRYSYRNQPTIVWWSLVRLGEALGELIGAGALVDDPTFEKDGVKDEAAAEPLVARAEKIIGQIGEEYRAVFLAKYKRLMAARLGLRSYKESDFDGLFSPLLDTLEALELDFNLFFRRLSSVPVAELATEDAAREKAGLFFYSEGVTGVGGEEEGRKRLGSWLCSWRDRISDDWANINDGASGPVAGLSGFRDVERQEAMRMVNPNFVARGWVLDEVIRRVEKDGERDVLRRLLHMTAYPFASSWHGRTFDGKVYQGDAEEERRWTENVPRTKRAMQCSCSS